MRILFLTQILPYPLDSGAKIRAYHVLQYLTARHQVTLISFTRAGDPPAAIDHLRSICHAVHLVTMKRSHLNEAFSLGCSLLTSQPFTILRDQRVAMRQLITNLLIDSAFDAIHADQLAMAQYALFAAAVILDRPSTPRPKLVLDAHNAYYLIPQRMASVSNNFLLKKFLQLEAKRMAHYEAKTYRRFDHVLTVTENDLAGIKHLGDFASDTPRFTVLPICVDATQPIIQRRSAARGLLMLGGLHWPPNADAVRWFVREVWPVIRAQVPGVQLFIVGARPPQDIGALQSELITVTGYVDDVTKYLEASAALVVALRSGGGMRVKIVEALQWGLPIISTSIGCEGIDVTDHQNIILADDPQSFAAAIVSVLSDRSLSQQLTDRGRELVAQRYDWRKIYSTLNSVYPIDRS